MREMQFLGAQCLILSQFFYTYGTLNIKEERKKRKEKKEIRFESINDALLSLWVLSFHHEVLFVTNFYGLKSGYERRGGKSFFSNQ